MRPWILTWLQNFFNIDSWKVNKSKWSSVQKCRSSRDDHARRIPSLLRGSVKVCVASEDILIISILY
jgi:hypothetical protein